MGKSLPGSENLSMAMKMDDGADVLSSIETLLRSAGDMHEQPEAHGDLPVVEKPAKKHSGPRKRRAKKKPTNAKQISEPSPNSLSVDTGQPASPPPLTREEDAARLKALRASAAPFVPVSPPAPLPPRSPRLSPTLTDLSHPLASPPTGYAYSTPMAYRRSFLLRSTPLFVAPDASEFELRDRAYWTQFVIDAAEKERERRLSVLQQMQREEEDEIQRRRAWAIAAIEQEQQAMMRERFLDNMKNTQWFQSTITRIDHDYEVVCPNSWFGCTFSCMLKDLEAHVEHCDYRQVPDTLDQVGDESVAMDLYTYDVVCPNAMLGCSAIFPREKLAKHLASCPVSAMTREQEWQERQEWQQNVIEMTEEERQRRMDEHRGQQDRFSFNHLQRLYEEQTAMMHVVLHEEIVRFTSQCQAEADRIRPAIEIAIARIQRVVQELWGVDARVESYGSFATQLYGDHSDVDLVVFGATTAVKNPSADERTRDAKGMTSKECVSLLAAQLSSQPSGTYHAISAITRASIPLVKVVVTVETDLSKSDDGGNTFRIPFDITFDDPSDPIHNGIASASLLQTLLEEFYGLRELTLVLKHFLATRGLNDPYIGGLSSYGLVLMILFVLREQGALVRSAKAADQDLGSSRCGEDTSSETLSTSGTAASPLSRCDAQKLKGVVVAKEIIHQARVRQSVLMAAAVNGQSGHDRRSVAAAWEFLTQEAHSPRPPASNRASPHKSRSSEPFLLGKLLMDFLHWYGTDFRHTFDQISVLSTAEASASEGKGAIASPTRGGPRTLSPNQRPTSASMSPTFQPSPHEASLMIQDPLQRGNNVGKTCYRISQVLRDFSDFLSVLTALIVRGTVMVPGAPTISENEESTKSDRERPSSSQRILSSVFQMKQATVGSSASTRTASSSSSG
jgi:non-canonical poly(A) RNA polymerase PAPD5/7